MIIHGGEILIDNLLGFKFGTPVTHKHTLETVQTSGSNSVSGLLSSPGRRCADYAKYFRCFNPYAALCRTHQRPDRTFRLLDCSTTMTPAGRYYKTATFRSMIKTRLATCCTATHCYHYT